MGTSGRKLQTCPMPPSRAMTHGNWIPSLLVPRLTGFPESAKAEPYVFADNAGIINIGAKDGVLDAAGFALIEGGDGSAFPGSAREPKGKERGL